MAREVKRVGGGFLAAILLSGTALAQVADDGASVKESEGAPRLLVMGFDDQGGLDCNPRLARYGRCIEEVQFSDMSAAWRPELTPSDVDLVRWRNIGRLYSSIWEDMAYRWTSGGDVLEETLRAEAIVKLPDSKNQWEAYKRADDSSSKEVYSIPRRTLWLGDVQWIDPLVYVDPRDIQIQEYQTPPTALYPLVKQYKSVGLVPTPPMVRMKGRFAVGVRSTGSVEFPYDIMDGDITTSAPFFEQLFPYRRALAEDEEDSSTAIPFSSFSLSSALKEEQIRADVEAANTRYSTLKALQIPDDVPIHEALSERGSAEFELFFDRVGREILRHADTDYSPVHMRVLAAATAMQNPPIGRGGGAISSGMVNSASVGETDLVISDEARLSDYISNRGGDLSLTYLALPSVIVDKYLDESAEWKNPSDEYLHRLMTRLVEELGDDIASGVKAGNLDDTDLLYREGRMIRALDEASIQAWVNRSTLDGVDLTRFTRMMKQLALEVSVGMLDEVQKQQRQSEILLSHIDMEVFKALMTGKGIVRTPAETEGVTEVAWTKVLAAHNRYPDQMVQQYRGRVDPLAICTTKSKLESLEQPAFKAITIDQLFVAPVGLRTVDEVLDEVALDLPFIMLDDPSRNKPDLKLLVRLPGDRAIYRLQWQVWSGWHVLWGAEALTEDGKGRKRIAMRTGAFCDDTVMAQPEIVPSLVRAAMLDGDFRPAVPIRKGAEADRSELQAQDNDEAKEDVEGLIAEGQEIDSEIKELGDSEDIVDGITASKGLLDRAVKLTAGNKKKPLTSPVNSMVVKYVRGLVHPKLQDFRSATEENPLGRPVVVVMFDHGLPGDKERVRDFQPRVPYFDEQYKTKGGEFLRTAGWAVEMMPMETNPDYAARMLSPAFIPSELVTATNTGEKQVWKRKTTGDWWFAGGIAFSPMHYMQTECVPGLINFQPSSSPQCLNSVVNDVESVNLVYNDFQEAIGLDFQALSVQWLVNDRRFGIEFGPEVRLDLSPAGTSLFYDNTQDPLGDIGAARTDYWNWNLQAGVIVGLRWQPRPYGLSARGAKAYPWGAPLEGSAGKSKLSRLQWGLRLGGLIGPANWGVLASGVFEPWVSWSVRRKKGPQASFTPYRPAILLGPFARVQASVPISTIENFPYKLNVSVMAMVGFRAQFRLTSAPELPAVE